MSALTEAQTALLPTDADIGRYRHRGWYITKPIIPDHEIEHALLGVQRHYRGERDAEMPEAVKPHLLDWKTESTGGALRVDTYIAYQNRQIGVLLGNPLIGAIAALLAGSEEIRLFTSALIYKPPRDHTSKDRIGWHTDLAYFKTCTSENLLTAWIPLQDCDQEMGTPSFIEGSHLWEDDAEVERLRDAKTFISSAPDMPDRIEARLRGCKHPIQIAHTRLRRGQVCFLHSKIFHYTGPNRSDRPRLAVSLFLQDKDNRYRRVHDENGNVIVYTHDLICRQTPDGLPDYADPTFCPVLWPMRNSSTRVCPG